jgi:hypothetical protein
LPLTVNVHLFLYITFLDKIPMKRLMCHFQFCLLRQEVSHIRDFSNREE